MKQNKYVEFEADVLQKVKKGERIVEISGIPNSTVALFKRKFEERNPEIAKELFFTKDGVRFQMLGSRKHLSKEEIVTAMRAKQNRKDELSDHDETDAYLRKIHGLKNEIKSAHRLTEKAISNQKDAERRYERIVEEKIKMDAEIEAYKQVVKQQRSEIEKLKINLEDSDTKHLMLMEITATCSSCKTTGIKGELVKDIILFVCPSCGRKEYRRITDSILNIEI